MTLGLIPYAYTTHYGEIRDRIRQDGKHWLQPELRDFFDSKLVETNKEWSKTCRCIYTCMPKIKNMFGKIFRKVSKLI